MLKRFAILFIFFIALLEPAAALAQGDPQINALTISLWPAYDRPGVLVIYHLTLATTTALPTPLSIRIPKAAGQPYAVAYKDATGKLLNIVYNTADSNAWTAVNFTATQPELQIEYYDPGLTTTGQDHSFTYTWAGDYDVASMSIEIQQPFGASNMRISSGSVTSRTGDGGLTYYIKDVGQVAANQQFTLDITYTKASDRLSVEDMQIQPTAPLTTNPTWKENLQTYLPWILGGLGVIVIGVGGIWYWQSGRQGNPAQKSRKRRRSRAAQAEVESVTAPAESAIYCHQCGKRASSADQFCRSCGARLRID